MRRERQFAMVLAIALALGVTPVFARQHNDAPHPAVRSGGGGQVRSAPRRQSYPGQRQVARPPQSYNGSRFAGGQNSVPRPPQAGGSHLAGQEPQVGNARPVPRPPTIGTPRDVHNGPHAGDWLRRYNTLPAQQRQHALENDPNFKRLPPADQQRYRNQLNQFSNKSPQDQQRLINRMDAWGHLSQAQKDQARNTYNQLKSMPSDRQQQVNQAYHRLRAMPPSAREQVLNSPEFQGRYSEQERTVIRNMTDINNSLPH